MATTKEMTKCMRAAMTIVDLHQEGPDPLPLRDGRVWRRMRWKTGLQRRRQRLTEGRTRRERTSSKYRFHGKRETRASAHTRTGITQHCYTHGYTVLVLLLLMLYDSPCDVFVRVEITTDAICCLVVNESKRRDAMRDVLFVFFSGEFNTFLMRETLLW